MRRRQSSTARPELTELQTVVPRLASGWRDDVSSKGPKKVKSYVNQYNHVVFCVGNLLGGGKRWWKNWMTWWYEMLNLVAKTDCLLSVFVFWLGVLMLRPDPKEFSWAGNLRFRFVMVFGLKEVDSRTMFVEIFFCTVRNKTHLMTVSQWVYCWLSTLWLPRNPKACMATNKCGIHDPWSFNIAPENIPCPKNK